MPDFFDSQIFNALSPANFNALSDRFHLGFHVPEDVSKIPVEQVLPHWHALLNIGTPVVTEHENPDDETSPIVHKLVGKFQDFLQRLHDLVETKCSIMQLAQDLIESGETTFSIPIGFNEWNPYNRGAFVFLSDGEFWESLCNLATAQKCKTKRLWIDYYDLPQKPPKCQDKDLRKLEGIMVTHFLKSHPNTTCHIHSYIRKHQYYYFATMQDNPQYDEVLVKERTEDGKSTEKFDQLPFIHPFRIIFAYDERGQFSIYGEMDKRDTDPLASELVRLLVDYDGMLTRVPKTAYYLDDLKRADFDWQIEAGDGIETIRLSTLTIYPLDTETPKITIADRNRNIHACLDNFLNRGRLPNDAIGVFRADIQFVMDRQRSNVHSFTFGISQESCGLKNLEDEQRELGEKYVRKLGFIHHPDISLHTILKAARSERPVIGQASFGGLRPDFLQSLVDFGIISQTSDATEVVDGEDTYSIVSIAQENGEKRLGYVDKFGKTHFVEQDELKRYKVEFLPVIKCIHDELGCTGNIEERLPGLVWCLGTTGREHRDVYAVRNWDCNSKVVDYLCNVKNSSLVLHFGHTPRIVQIGSRRSDAPKEKEHLEAQYYQVENLTDYTVRDGYVFDGDVVRKGLEDMKDAKRAGKLNGRPAAKQGDRYREALERWLWLWFDARLKAAKVAEFPGSRDPYVKDAWLDYEYYTQKAVCECVNVPEPEFSRARNYWKNHHSSICTLMLLICDQFVKRRSHQCIAVDGGTAKRLNDFFHAHSEIIICMRNQRPNYI